MCEPYHNWMGNKVDPSAWQHRTAAHVLLGPRWVWTPFRKNLIRHHKQLLRHQHVTHLSPALRSKELRNYLKELKHTKELCGSLHHKTNLDQLITETEARVCSVTLEALVESYGRPRRRYNFTEQWHTPSHTHTDLPGDTAIEGLVEGGQGCEGTIDTEIGCRMRV